jgi:hypothetical protein
MAKKESGRVPVAEEKEFISLHSEVKSKGERMDELKKKFIAYNKQGLTFKLLTVVDGADRFAPPWKELVDELLTEMGRSDKAIKKYHACLRKRFPAKPVADSFKPPEE